MSLVISIEHLSKAYRLGVIGGGTLRGDLSRYWAKLRGRPDPLLRVGQEHHERNEAGVYWALQDVNFQVRKGEVLGIIGRNGAGKSTLLKILSRVTGPTKGRVRVRGRIASLLEVGTGFHPELTGRENVYLNGTILGMSRSEIRAKFEQIVDFADIDDFIDTPVKRYSSGMYVRLAFAVAAHLEPEILIVDEVLAVGDAQFQRKCLGKMKDVAGGGRTVLFVSHNMAAIRVLCSSAVLLSGGEVEKSGSVDSVIDAYMEAGEHVPNSREWGEGVEAPGNEHVRMEFVRVVAPGGNPAITIDSGAILEIGFFNAQAGINLDCTVHVKTNEGMILFESGRIVSSNQDSVRGHYRVRGRIPPHFLNTGRFMLSVQFGRDQCYRIFGMDEVVAFDVENTATGRGRNLREAPGPMRPLLDWTQEVAPDPCEPGV